MKVKDFSEWRDCGVEMLIILNKERTSQEEKSGYANKFQTHLSTDFLNLFAD